MTFFRDENGQGLVEYALIIGLIAVVVIVAVVLIGRVAKQRMNQAGEALSTDPAN